MRGQELFKGFGLLSIHITDHSQFDVASDSIIFMMQPNIFRIGKRVLQLRVGDRIAIEPGYSCRKCSHCKEGCYNICREMKFCATPPVDGNLRSLIVITTLIYQLQQENNLQRLLFYKFIWFYSYRQFYCHPADFCFKIPDSMSLEEAALVEPTAVAIHACRRAGVSLGKVLTYIILTYNIKLE